MTIDKIKHILSSTVFDHISGLNREQLEVQKSALVADMELIENSSPLHYSRTVELYYINLRLS